MHRTTVKTGSPYYAFMLSPRCRARTRRSTPCLSPAVYGKNRCRMHGGAKGSGAPKGSQNALKHGYTTDEAILDRRELRAKIQLFRDFLKIVEM